MKREICDCPECGPGTCGEDGYCVRCGMCLVVLVDEKPPKPKRRTPPRKRRAR